VADRTFDSLDTLAGGCIGSIPERVRIWAGETCATAGTAWGNACADDVLGIPTGAVDVGVAAAGGGETFLDVEGTGDDIGAADT
jgi:hypothetical protein